MKKRMALQDLDVFQNHHLSAVIRMLELDRKRIAQGLHDDIESKLNVISLNCHLLKIPNLTQKEIEEITKNIIEYTSKALNSSKQMTHSLLPPVLERFGLHAGIEELCAEFSSPSLVIQYENNLKFNFNDNDRHVHVFRIVKELVSNSIQHGKATSISISFDEIEGENTCRYSDNGNGFDSYQLENCEGLGMKNIAARVAILEGNLSVKSQMGEGISVAFNF
ncbi:sensor histidine kinase [Flavobacterium sp.]|uniref:sensor histidine kinase n=1 Tax=Flavobacterium sp. TaxID=239 RepID=UPI002C5A49C7|nr:ATP-binding protein [Flavobacterium sp.]HSD06008.1 ATP-binding protein [Flavobacterium sp.]